MRRRVIVIASHFAQWIRLSISAAHKMTRGSCTSQKCIIARARPPAPLLSGAECFWWQRGSLRAASPGREGERAVGSGAPPTQLFSRETNDSATWTCFSQVLGLICKHSTFWRYPPPSSLIGFSNYAPLFVLCRRTAGFPSRRSDVLRDAMRGRGRPAALSRVVGHLASLMKP